MPDTQNGLVLVTGGSGYIAGFCIAELLRQGWRVRASIRSLAKAAAARSAIAALGVDAAGVEFVAATLDADAGWGEAAKGADYVLHIASPVPAADPKTDDEIVRPARDGALRVLKAARDAGVKRVVMTSSVAAIAYGRGGRETPHTEADWTDETNRADTSAYERSKTLAERAAWDWVKRGGGKLELTTVNPGLVLGPAPSADFSASLEAIKKLLDGSMPALPNFSFPVVDVRDLARLHVLVMTAPEAAGQRFIGSGDLYSMADMAAMLRKGLGNKARKVPTFRIPDFVVRLFGLFDPVVRTRAFELGKVRRASSEKAKRLLGWTTRPAEESVLDAARSLIALGVV
jgi:dihydroflavonol-4-reductase